MLSLCNRIGAPIKTEKVEGPTTCLTFLGIVLNTNTMKASISYEQKYHCYVMAIHLYFEKCTKRKLLSLISKLSFACKVVSAGWIFLCWLIDLSCSVSKLHHHIRWSYEARLHLTWWSNFFSLHGQAPLWFLIPRGPLVQLCNYLQMPQEARVWVHIGQTIGSNQNACSPKQAKQAIVQKELYTIVSAVNTWDHHWTRWKILFHCDNNTVVDIWRRGLTVARK